jgi:hypothetical protein
MRPKRTPDYIDFRSNPEITNADGTKQSLFVFYKKGEIYKGITDEGSLMRDIYVSSALSRAHIVKTVSQGKQKERV